MNPATEIMKKEISASIFKKPTNAIISNVTAKETIDPDEIILDGFQEDQDKLAELQSKLREERAKKIARSQREKKRQELYYQTALSRTIDFVSKNIDIKYFCILSMRLSPLPLKF